MPADAVMTAQSAEAEQFQTGQVLTITAGHAVHDTYAGFLPPLLPAFIESLSMSKAEAGLLTVFYQAPSLLQPFIGHLADRISLRVLVILAPAVTATAMSLLGIAQRYAGLALLLMVAGLSSATLHAVGPVIAGRLSGRSLGRGMGVWMVGGELGRTLGPLVIAGYFRWQPESLSYTPWLMVVGWLTSLVLFLRFRNVESRLPPQAPGLPWGQALRVMGPLLIPLTGIIVARSFMSSALTTYLPTYLAEEGAELWLAGIALSVVEAAGMVGALLGGSLSDRLGRRTILFASMLFPPLLMGIFLAVGSALYFPLLLAMGLTALSVTPVIMALVQESFPENRALANGVYMALSFLIRSGVVVIVGAMGDRWGMRTSFLASALISLLGLPFLWFLPKGRR
jgi:FSR family fosmidomycin resistance protein-like MFS transporter